MLWEEWRVLGGRRKSKNSPIRGQLLVEAVRLSISTRGTWLPPIASPLPEPAEVASKQGPLSEQCQSAEVQQRSARGSGTYASL